MAAESNTERRVLVSSMRQALWARPALLVRGSSRRITIMRFRPANIRVINRRDDRLGRHSHCFPLAREKQRKPTPRMFLTCSSISEDQAGRLQAEAQKEREAAENERRLREEARALIKQQANEIAELEEKNATLDDDLRRYAVRANREGMVLSILGMLGGVTLWHYAPGLSALLSSRRVMPHLFQPIAHLLIGCVGIGLFCLPGWIFLRQKTWTQKAKVSSMSIILIAALALSNLVDKSTWQASWSGILEAAVLVGSLLFTVFSPKKVLGD